ncbi:MAG: clostripain-related cysteine peptidase [Patescibacteria group bacterium]|nr:clostripain-related cysteine peptidase [Patescibacteria group bacterium]
MFIALYILLVSAISTKAAVPWTMFFYLSGDNDLQEGTEKYVKSIIANLDSISKPYPINIAIEVDAFDDSIPTRRYFFFGDSMIKENIDGEVNMADEKELIGFTQAAIQRMGATSKYALIIYGHGCNWKGIIQDKNPFDWMGIPNQRFQTAISGIKEIIGQNINVLGLLACEMQIWEVQMELQGKVDLTVGCWQSAFAPEKTGYFTGFLKNSTWTPESLAVAISKTYGFSAIRTPMISNLTQDVNQLGLILKSAPDSVKKRIIDNEIIVSKSRSWTRQIDLGAFVTKIEGDSLLDNSVRAIAADIKSDIQKMTIYSPDSLLVKSAIGIYFPQIARNYEADYGKILASTTCWDEYLNTNDFPYYWCYGWQTGYPLWKPSINDTTRKNYWRFSGGGVKQTKIHFAYLNLSDGDTLLIYDSKDTVRYTGKKESFFTPIMEANFTVEYKGQSLIPADCFFLDNLAWTTDAKLAIEEEKITPKPADISVWPNPFRNELNITASLESEAIIYDISGRVIKKLSLKGKSTCWNGKDGFGKTVNSGIYFLKIGNKSPKKIVKLTN